MSGAGVDAVLTALAATYTAAAPTGVEVFDGQPVDAGTQFLCVGWDETDQPAVQATRTAFDAGLSVDLETLEVSCLLTCWQGDEELPQLRADTLAIYDAFDAALAEDRQLGGAAMIARVTAYEYEPGQREDGALAQIRFTVTVQATN